MGEEERMNGEDLTREEREKRTGGRKQEQLEEEVGQSIGSIQSQKNRFAREQGKGVGLFGGMKFTSS